jgi:amino acid adenylation domain-containing protein
MMNNLEKNFLLSSPKFVRYKDYWTNKLSGDIPRTKILIAEKNPYHLRDRIEKVNITLTDHFSRQVIEMSKNSNLSIYLILLTGLKTLIYRYGGDKDIITASPLYKERETSETLNDIVFIRNQIYPDMTFKQLLLAIRQSTLEAYQNQDYPFEKLTDYFSNSHQSPDNKMFSTVVCALTNIHGQVETGKEELDDRLIFSFAREEDNIKGEIRYNQGIYNGLYLEQIAKHLVKILEESLQNINMEITGIPLMSPEEKKRLIIDFNKTRAEYPGTGTIPLLFAVQAAADPDKIALAAQSEDEKHSTPGVVTCAITYRELNQKSEQLAHLLKEKGVGPDNIVCLMTDRSLEMILGIMGILKAGAAYMPIDLNCPADRIEYMLADSSANVLVTTRMLAREGSKLRKYESKKNFEIFLLDFSTLPSSHPHLPPAPANSLAYIIYTSGSTGKPKGVMVEHRNVLNVIWWFARTYNIRKNPHVVLLANYTFDSSIEDIFAPLLHGGTLYIPPKEVIWEKDLLREFVDTHRINIVNFVPRALKEFLGCERHLESLNVVISGGERLEKPVRDLLIGRGYRLYNNYGPTETTVDALSQRCTADGEVTLGQPAANTTIYIFDCAGNLLPVGVPGELWIGGDGVARGYLNNIELTKEKFIPNPFVENDRIYKTGDLCRWLVDGTVEFLGRIDRQVKIRGFRIEPGEIEYQLSTHKKVKEVVVAAVNHQARIAFAHAYETPEDLYLCAYIVPTDNGEMTEIDIEELKKYLSQSLPGYMIPGHFVLLKQIPLTVNGKIDYKALPSPQLDRGEAYIAPRNRIEKRLMEIWSEVLQIDEKDTSTPPIGINDNFFKLGGHSLKALSLLSKINREFNIKVPLAELFDRSTIKELSRHIEKAAPDRYVSIEPFELKEFYTQSSTQKRFYFLQQLKAENITYNIPQCVVLEGEVDKDKLEDVFIRLIKRHESLRTSFEIINGEPIQVVHKNVEFNIQYRDAWPLLPGTWTPGSEDIEESKIEEIITDFRAPFDLAKAPLLRVRLTNLGNGKHILLVDMHHIITDGVSMTIIMEDFSALYVGKNLPPLKLQYKDYSEWYNKEKKTGKIKQQEEYWLRQFQGDIPRLNLPIDYERPAFQDFAGSSVYFEIGKDQTEALKALALREKTNLNIVMLAIFNIFLAKICQQEDIIIGIPAAGRSNPDLEDIVGAFINSLALRNYPTKEKTFIQFMKEVKEKTLAAIENQDYPFEELVTHLPLPAEANRNPLFDVMTSLTHMDSLPTRKANDIPDTKVNVHQYSFETGIAHIDMGLAVKELENSLPCQIIFSTTLFKPSTIEEIKEYYINILNQVLINQDIKLADIVISDDLLTAQSNILLKEDNEYAF